MVEFENRTQTDVPRPLGRDSSLHHVHYPQPPSPPLAQPNTEILTCKDI